MSRLRCHRYKWFVLIPSGWDWRSLLFFWPYQLPAAHNRCWRPWMPTRRKDADLTWTPVDFTHSPAVWKEQCLWSTPPPSLCCSLHCQQLCSLLFVSLHFRLRLNQGASRHTAGFLPTQHTTLMYPYVCFLSLAALILATYQKWEMTDCDHIRWTQTR